jgi:erythromycin esterase-like protein
MRLSRTDPGADALRARVTLLPGSGDDWAPLLGRIGDASIILLGEASHGTHEFYHERAEITKRLIEERGITAVVVEADWPDADRVNAYVRGRGHDDSGLDALEGFERFPQWMWRNADVLDFVEWLRIHNIGRPAAERCGFYGMDLYSLYGSIRAVLRYLERVDPAAAQRARYRYACLDHTGEDPQSYGYAAAFDLTRSCEDDVVHQLLELRERAADLARRDGRPAADAFFSAEQNARVVANAERYYRSMFHGRVSSWNLRDEHMAETVDELLAHLERENGARPKMALWAHNSHLGDARATQMGEQGELNVGQLMRERFGDAVFSIGFTTHTGTVTAASAWDGPAETKPVRPSLPGSYERLFHDTEVPRFFVDLHDPALRALLHAPRLERAIGVIYAPHTERASHYFFARLADQFDAVIHIDTTTAVEPIERMPLIEQEEPAETFPSGV